MVGANGPLKNRTSLLAQRLKHLSAMWEIWVQSLGWEDSLEQEVAVLFLEDSMDGGAWWAAVHGVAESRT